MHEVAAAGPTIKSERQVDDNEQQHRRREASNGRDEQRESSVTGNASKMQIATSPISGAEERSQQLAGSMGSNCCAGCREPIRDKFIFSVIDLHWHQDCVQCADCSLKLNERCYTFDGKLYCRSDYWRRFGPKCFACRESIERNELVQRIKGNRVYHLKCFTCNECHKQLKAGEQLHLIDGKRLLCKQDYSQQLAGSKSGLAGKSNGFEQARAGTQQAQQPQQQQQQQTYYTLTSNQQQHQAAGGEKLQAVQQQVKQLERVGKLGLVGGSRHSLSGGEEELDELDPYA